MAQIQVNEAYYQVLETKARYVVLYGGRGAGRSTFAVQLALILISQSQYFRGYFMREVFGDIRESLFRDFLDIIEDAGVEDDFHIIHNSMVITHKRTGNMIISKGFKKSSGGRTGKLKSISGATHVFIEEADEVIEEDFNKLDDSVRTQKTKQAMIMCLLNTEYEEGFINKKFFIDNKPIKDPNYLIIHTTYKDNIENLHPSFIEKLESYKYSHPEYYKVFTLGLWGGGVKGRIFTDWHVIEAMPGEYEKTYGLDFGFSNDPAAIVEIERHNKRIWCEQVVYKEGLTNALLKLEFLNARPGINPKGVRIYADSAEPKSITELKTDTLIEATETLQKTYPNCKRYITQMREKGQQRVYYRLPGFNVLPAVKGPDSIKAGINLLKEYEIFVTSSSKDIWREAKYYKWAQDRDGNMLNTPVDLFNHSMDALRYNVYTQAGKPKRYIKRL